MSNLGDSKTPIEGESFGLPAGAELTEDANGNLAIADSSGSIVLVRDETAGAWDLNNNSLTNIDAIDAISATLERVDSSLGYGWSDMVSSRSFDTWYQAPSDKDIYFMLTGRANVDGTDINIVVDLNDSQNSNILTRERRPSAPTDTDLSLGSFRVPAGHYYRAQALGDSADYSLKDWGELR